MMKFIKNDHNHNLLVAVGNWVESNGGKVLVAGGIEIQRYADDAALTFKVAIKCTGKQPTKESEANE